MDLCINISLSLSFSLSISQDQLAYFAETLRAQAGSAVDQRGQGRQRGTVEAFTS